MSDSEPAVGPAKLELVRRLDEVWEGPGFDSLADRVLRRDPPGRGMDQLRLLDPSEVPTEELIRVGTGVLLDLVLEAPRARTPRARAIWRRTAPPVLAATGFDELLTRSWAGRVEGGSGSRWRRFVQLWAGRDALPPSVDLAARAEQSRHRPVEVYVGSAAPVAPLPLTVESVDLLRRLNPFLAVHLADPGDARANAVRLLTQGSLRPLAIPEPHRAWARRWAERIADQLSAGGYSVHGDLGEFVAGAHGRPLYREDVLDRLVEVLVKIVKEEQG